jgi:transcriptional regulator with XRE-family HTH domain
MSDNQRARSEIFADHVRRLRDDRGWSQAELGRRLGEAGHPLRQSRVAAIEASGSVTIDQAGAFAEVLGVPIEALLYEEPPATGALQIRRLTRIKAGIEAIDDEVQRLLSEAIADRLPGSGQVDAVAFTDSARAQALQHLSESE